MSLVIQAIGGLVTLLLPILTQFAARWGYKVALVAAVMAIYTSCWIAILGLMTAAKAILPAAPFSDFSLQFLPGRPSVSTGVTLYLGTLATLRWWDYMRMAFGVAAKVGA